MPGILVFGTPTAPDTASAPAFADDGAAFVQGKKGHFERFIPKFPTQMNEGEIEITEERPDFDEKEAKGERAPQYGGSFRPMK